VKQLQELTLQPSIFVPFENAKITEDLLLIRNEEHKGHAFKTQLTIENMVDPTSCQLKRVCMSPSYTNPSAKRSKTAVKAKPKVQARPTQWLYRIATQLGKQGFNFIRFRIRSNSRFKLAKVQALASATDWREGSFRLITKTDLF
jgi:hypothetical protein